MHVFEVRNAELLESITQQAAEHGITSAAIVALIGGIDSFTVSTNPADDPTAHTYRQLPAASRDDRHRGDRRRQAPHPRRDAVQGDRAIGGICTRRTLAPRSPAPT